MKKFRQHRWWFFTVLLTAPVLAFAAVPNLFTPNTVISSSQVNANFAALDTRFAALETALPSKSAFMARQTQAQNIASGLGAGVVFDTEDLDTANEFGSVYFTSKTGGVYDVTCAIQWKIATAGTSTYFQTTIFINQNTGSGIQNEIQSAGVYPVVAAHGLIRLAPNDSLYCQAYQSSGATQTLQNDANSVNKFSAIRIAP